MVEVVGEGWIARDLTAESDHSVLNSLSETADIFALFLAKRWSERHGNG